MIRYADVSIHQNCSLPRQFNTDIPTFFRNNTLIVSVFVLGIKHPFIFCRFLASGIIYIIHSVGEFVHPSKYVQKANVKNYSAHRFGSNEVLNLSIGVYFCAL